MTATDRQLSYIRSLAQERGLNADEVVSRAEALTDRAEVSRLIDRLKAVPVPVAPPTADEVARLDALRAVLDRLDGRDRSFAESLLAQHATKGRLSDGQWPWVTKLTGLATAPKAEPGLYRLPDGTIVRVGHYEGRLVAKRLVILGTGRGSFRNDRSLLGRVPTEGTPLTEDEAQVFGRQYKFCVACARTLSDDRSLAVGYGPECAKDHSWFYPNYEQASELLGRPVQCQHLLKPVQTVTHYSSPQLGTHSETVTYKCERCDHTESRLEGNYWSGD